MVHTITFQNSNQDVKVVNIIASSYELAKQKLFNIYGSEIIIIYHSLYKETMA